MQSCVPIDSIKDERVIEARKLSTTAGRQASQKCLLEDENIITWALDARIPVERVFVHNKIGDHPLLDTLLKREIECCSVSDGILKKISNTRYLIPFVGIGVIHENDRHIHGDFVIVLDNVCDRGNIGTIVRTACAFGIRDLFATTSDLDLYYKKTIEASRGKVFEVNVRRFPSEDDTINALKQQGFQIIATSPHAPVLQSSVKLQAKPVALVVGNETHGVSDNLLEQADLVVQIPMSRQVESLNVGVATGISVYEFKLKLVLAMLTKYIRTSLGREINVTGKYIQQALDAELAKVSSLNCTQAILLMILKCDETMTLQQVAKDTATFGQDLEQLLKPLFAADYIRQINDNSEDGIELTEQGEHLLGQLWGVLEATEDKVLHDFTREERQQFFDLLKRIQANCDEIIEKEPILAISGAT